MHSLVLSLAVIALASDMRPPQDPTKVPKGAAPQLEIVSKVLPKEAVLHTQRMRFEPGRGVTAHQIREAGRIRVVPVETIEMRPVLQVRAHPLKDAQFH